MNMRSGRAVYSVVQNQNAEVVSGPTDANDIQTLESDSIGTFIKANMSSYQYSSGSLRFPKNTAVDMTDPSNSEALQYFLHALGVQGSQLHSLSCHPYQWQERDTVDGNTDSSKLVLASRLGRGTDPHSGLELVNVPLDMEIGWDAVYALASVNRARYVHTWVEGDAILTIGREGIRTRL